jgi:hypothetical protein
VGVSRGLFDQRDREASRGFRRLAEDLRDGFDAEGPAMVADPRHVIPRRDPVPESPFPVLLLGVEGQRVEPAVPSGSEKVVVGRAVDRATQSPGP